MNSRPNRNNQVKRWTFTWYDVEAVDIELLFADASIQRAVAQQERCPQTQRLHWQGYIELHERKRFTQVKSVFADEHVHIEAAKGSAWSNYAYCTKEESGIEGTKIQKGEFIKPRSVERKEKGTELVDFIDRVKAGDTDLQLLDTYPNLFLRYAKQINRIRLAAADTDAVRPIGVILLTGTTHTGKSYAARQYSRWHNVPAFVLTPTKNQTCWFDGYQGQPLLIIEEYDGAISFRKLLMILDHYHSNLEVKGDFTVPRWTEVIITSNGTPRLWYPDEADVSPLERRIHKTITTTPGEWALDKWETWKSERIPTVAVRPFEVPPAPAIV